MTAWQTVTGVLGALVAVGALTACGGGDDDAASPSAPPAATPRIARTGPASAAGGAAGLRGRGLGTADRRPDAPPPAAPPPTGSPFPAPAPRAHRRHCATSGGHRRHDATFPLDGTGAVRRGRSRRLGRPR